MATPPASSLVRGWTRDPHSAEEVPVGGAEVLRHLPVPVAVSRVDGQLRACSARCTHIAGIVRYNDVEQTWDCPLHGSRFSLEGDVLEGPAVAPLQPRTAPRLGT